MGGRGGGRSGRRCGHRAQAGARRSALFPADRGGNPVGRSQQGPAKPRLDRRDRVSASSFGRDGGRGPRDRQARRSWSPRRATRCTATMSSAGCSAPDSRIFVAGHRGLVGLGGGARAHGPGLSDICCWHPRPSSISPINSPSAASSTSTGREAVIMAAALVGGIHANNSRPAEFIRDNLLIQDNVIDSALSQRRRQVRVSGIELHLSQVGAATDQGRLSADRAAGAHQRVVCHREDRRGQDVSSVSAAIWIQGHLPDADQSVRSRATTSISRTRTSCRR